jgi:hypothetical protein
VTLRQGCDGLSARRMAVLYTFRVPSLGRQGHRELMRSALLDLLLIIPTTACSQRNYVERYSRCKVLALLMVERPCPWPTHTYGATAGAAERTAYLREIGLAQRFQALDPLDCRAVLSDMLRGGMSAEALVFLWGTSTIPPEMYS